MTERPILFNAEMVKAILEGRKTQTRRVMKVQPEPSTVREGDFWFPSKKLESMVHISDLNPDNNVIIDDCHLFYQEYCCPFGQVGDQIWVRETWQGPLLDEEQAFEYWKLGAKEYEKPEYCEYRADGGIRPEFMDAEDNIRQGWRPSLHMPRWASRIQLEITDIRVERLQDISQADAIAEGAPADHLQFNSVARGFGFPDFARSWFWQTWESIYLRRSGANWQVNPWVWVVEFRRSPAPLGVKQ